MKISKIEWRNFNSYGNQISEVEYSDTGELVVLQGANGNGKSTVSEVILFSLFGRVERKNKGDLVNRTNGALWTKIHIQSRGHDVVIERGILPNIFIATVDGFNQDVAGNKNIQDWLENEIFDIPYHVFKNLLVLSVNDFKSFLSMTNTDKRAIIDQLFGFSGITQMREIVREKRKLLGDLLNKSRIEISTLRNTIGNLKTSILQAKKDSERNTDSEIEQILSELEMRNRELHESIEKIQKVNSILETKKSENEQKKSLFSDLDTHLKNAKTRIKLLDLGKCPTCGTPLDSPLHKSEHENLITETSETEKQKSLLADEIHKLNHDLSKIQIGLNEFLSKKSSIIQQISGLENRLLELKNRKVSVELENLILLLKNTATRERDISVQIGEYSADDGFYQILETALGENGVRKMALQTVIPGLNSVLDTVCNDLHIPYKIRFSEDFEVDITQMGESISHKSLSTGERKRVDFAIIVSLLKVVKTKYPSVNVLFLDEIFSSIDPSGIWEILKTLRRFSKEYGVSTWVVNHTELPLEHFDRFSTVWKEGIFSKIKVERVL